MESQKCYILGSIGYSSQKSIGSPAYTLGVCQWACFICGHTITGTYTVYDVLSYVGAVRFIATT